MFTLAFWKAAGERALSTFAQAALALLVVAQGLLDIDWGQLLSVAGLAGLLSVLKSIIAAYVGEKGTPSFGPETLKSPRPESWAGKATPNDNHYELGPDGTYAPPPFPTITAAEGEARVKSAFPDDHYTTGGDE
jgi:hypothetical protein